MSYPCVTVRGYPVRISARHPGTRLVPTSPVNAEGAEATDPKNKIPCSEVRWSMCSPCVCPGTPVWSDGDQPRSFPPAFRKVGERGGEGLAEVGAVVGRCISSDRVLWRQSCCESIALLCYVADTNNTGRVYVSGWPDTVRVNRKLCAEGSPAHDW